MNKRMKMSIRMDLGRKEKNMILKMMEILKIQMVAERRENIRDDLRMIIREGISFVDVLRDICLILHFILI